MAKKRKNNSKAVSSNHNNNKTGREGSTTSNDSKVGSMAGRKKQSQIQNNNSNSKKKKLPFESFPLDLVISNNNQNRQLTKNNNDNNPSSSSTSNHHYQQQKQQLSLKEVHPGSSVWVIPNFFTTEECHKWIDFCDSSDMEYTQHPATRYVTNRECYRLQQKDACDLTSVLYQRLQTGGIIPKLIQALEPMRFPIAYQPVGFSPNLRLYKYTKGHAFGKHVDESNLVEAMGMTEITVLIYLSSCTGGATRFYPPYSSRKKQQSSSFAFDPEPGTMLLHVHGYRCLEHEADQVIDGVKYVLRTDVVFNSM